MRLPSTRGGTQSPQLSGAACGEVGLESCGAIGVKREFVPERPYDHILRSTWLVVELAARVKEHPPLVQKNLPTSAHVGTQRSALWRADAASGRECQRTPG